MKRIIVDKNEANQTLIKLLQKHLKDAPNSFFYKMLRKKNIVLNGKKATGNEKVQQDDCITLYLSDDTYNMFAGQARQNAEYTFYMNLKLPVLDIVYEDDDLIVINKPVGMLSQKAKPEDLSANEYLIAYCVQNNIISEKAFLSFRPSICNRLDRNTCGLLICGKSLNGLQKMAQALKDRSAEKYYICIVNGSLTQKMHAKGYLAKDESTNQVTIKEHEFKNSSYIETGYEPLMTNGKLTLLKVHLITGKTHQIRAHLSHLGLPIIGDPKYGDTKINQYIKEKYKIRSQFLCAKEMHIGDLYLEIPMPDFFNTVIEKESLR